MPQEMPTFLKYDIIPAVSTPEAIEALADVVKEQNNITHASIKEGSLELEFENNPLMGKVHVALDTGMNRNGCQPHELVGLIEVKVHKF